MVDFLKSLRVTDDKYTIKDGSTGCWVPGGLEVLMTTISHILIYFDFLDCY